MVATSTSVGGIRAGRGGAWEHSNYWNLKWYSEYRKYVTGQTPELKGGLEDCTNLSLSLIIDFAEKYGLPLTFTGNDRIRYISLAKGQSPASHLGDLQEKWPWMSVHKIILTWDDKKSYYDAVCRRINAEALFKYNTVSVRNPSGPEPGDLMMTTEHTALVFATYPPGLSHPKAKDKNQPSKHARYRMLK